jgi:hypothetical protein
VQFCAAPLADAAGLAIGAEQCVGGRVFQRMADLDCRAGRIAWRKKMNAHILAKVLGAAAALALLVPAAVSPAAAQVWSPGPPDYGYRPDAGYPPAPGYAVPPAYGAPQDYQLQGYGPRNYPPMPQYEPDEGYQLQGNMPQRYIAPYSEGNGQDYGADEGYGPDQTYGAGEDYGPSEVYGPNDHSLYIPPEVPPVRQGYVGPSAAPQDYGAGYPETGYPRTGWSYPQAGGRESYPSGRLVSAVDLNMRAGPSNEAPVRTVLPAGTPVRVTGATDSGWVQVDSPFGRGWVYSRYLAPA